METFMKAIRSAFLFAFVIASPLHARQVVRADARVRLVETGLRHVVAVAGETPARMSLAERMAHYKVPGVSIAVIDRGRIAWAKGYGFARSGRPVTPATRFSTGSVSKAVTAVAAMHLVQSGALSLDEDVNRILAGWKIPASPL